MFEILSFASCELRIRFSQQVQRMIVDKAMSPRKATAALHLLSLLAVMVSMTIVADPPVIPLAILEPLSLTSNLGTDAAESVE